MLGKQKGQQQQGEKQQQQEQEQKQTKRGGKKKVWLSSLQEKKEKHVGVSTKPTKMKKGYVETYREVPIEEEKWDG